MFKHKLRKSVQESSYLCQDCRKNKRRQVFAQVEIRETKSSERTVQNLRGAESLCIEYFILPHSIALIIILNGRNK
jgi:hypothetical protein